jgi:hypothetical protein
LLVSYRVLPIDAGSGCRGQDRVARQLGAVVADEGLGLAAPCDQEIEFAGNPKIRERGIGDGCEAPPRAIIEDRENPETPPAAVLVRDESAASRRLEPRVLAPAPSCQEPFCG